MALPSSGSISVSSIATELGISSAGLSLGSAPVRTLAGVPTGAIKLSDLHGKSAGATLVAGYLVIISTGYLGYHPALGSGPTPIGSLSGLIPGVSNTCLYMYNQGNDGKSQFDGDCVAALTGKSVYVNGVAYSMVTPTFASGKTTWNRPSNNQFPFVNGGSYQVHIA